MNNQNCPELDLIIYISFINIKKNYYLNNT